MQQQIATAAPPPPPQIPTLWSAQQVAEYCGVSKRTVYHWVSNDVLKLGEHYYKPQRTNKLRFDAAKVTNWFTGGKETERT